MADDVPVRVEVHRSGGFAGIESVTAADTATLPDGDAGELRRLVAQADLATLVPQLAGAAPGRPDRFQYDVTVDQGGQTYRFTVYDGQVPPEVKPLLALVTRAGGPSSPGGC